jgi:class 3 adenylate cyclase
VIKARGEGDSHFAVFHRATSAARAAIELQRGRSRDCGLAVRAALHLAEADPRDGDYLGMAVNHTARLRAVAHGGQIVCARVVADLVAMTDDITVRSLGIHRVRDLPQPLELFQIGATGLRSEFAPLMTLDTGLAPVMTIVVVDKAGSSQDMDTAPSRFVAFQGELFRLLRAEANEHDGRYLKLVGDGCLVAFEDPRAALAFANSLCRRSELGVRAAISTGITDIVEGELSGAAVWEAARQIKRVERGEIWTSPVVHALLTP